MVPPSSIRASPPAQAQPRAKAAARRVERLRTRSCECLRHICITLVSHVKELMRERAWKVTPRAAAARRAT
ncbi:MAG: hypothetical protein ACK4N5_19080 [Myxococcales bacterium]